MIDKDQIQIGSLRLVPRSPSNVQKIIDKDQIQIGSLLRLHDTRGDMYALVLDIDDDFENPPLFRLLIGEQTSWEYLGNIDGEIIS